MTINDELKKICIEKGKRGALDILIRADIFTRATVEKIVADDRGKLSEAISLVNENLVTNLARYKSLTILNGELISPRTIGYVINQVLKRGNVTPNDIYDWLVTYAGENPNINYRELCDAFVNNFGLFPEGDGRILGNTYKR